MNARQKLHQIHLQEWTVRFADQKASGLTVRQWCEQNNLSFHTYNYWKHLLKEEVVEQALPDIVPLSLPVLSDSGSSLETTVPDVRSIRANRSIRSNNSNVQMQMHNTKSAYLPHTPKISEIPPVSRTPFPYFLPSP